MPIRQDWQNMNLIQTLAVASLFYWQFHGYVRRRHTIRMDCQSVGLLLSEQKHVTAQRLPVAVQEPQEILEFINHPIMERVVFCTTIETNRFYPEIMNKAPRIEERVEAMEEIARLGRPTMVTAEPLMQFDHEEWCLLSEDAAPSW